MALRVRTIATPMTGILLLAFILRVVGVLYGLPNNTSTDEGSLILGALGMLELKTVVPALHPAAFAPILYYPPYLCYVYLLPFLAIILGKLVFWHASIPLFKAYLLSDLSVFFIFARFINVCLGVLSVYLVYAVAERLFHSKRAGIVAAFLLATSLTSIGLSMVARHWVPVTCLFLFVLYILTKEHIPEHRRYCYALVLIGLGVGVSLGAVFIAFAVLLWFLVYGRMSLLSALTDRWVLGGLAAFLFLFPIPFLLDAGTGAVMRDQLSPASLVGKSVGGLIASPLHILLLNVYAEPVLVVLFLIGLPLLWRYRRPAFYLIFGFFLLYGATYYFLFALEARFMLPLIPLYALAGGFAFDVLSKKKWLLILMCCMLVIPAVVSLRFAFLTSLNDTRTLARNWVLGHVSAEDKIIVPSLFKRLPATASAVQELRSLEPGAIRRSDEADETLSEAEPGAYGVHALNLANIPPSEEETFFNALPHYAKTHGYTYLMYSPEEGAAASSAQGRAYLALIQRATAVASWRGFTDYSLTDSSFTGPLWELFSSGRHLGPDVQVYKLQ